MKRILGIALGAALALAPITTLAVGQTPAQMHPKSALRYVSMTYTFSTTTDVTAALVGVCPPGGADLKDVVLVQDAAGEGGTSWVATPIKNSTNLVSTAGGFTLAGGAGLSTNTAKTAVILTNPTGGTRPVISATAGVARCAGGDRIKVTIALTGTYTTAVSGAVALRWEPLF